MQSQSAVVRGWGQWMENCNIGWSNWISSVIKIKTRKKEIHEKMKLKWNKVWKRSLT